MQKQVQRGPLVQEPHLSRSHPALHGYCSPGIKNLYLLNKRAIGTQPSDDVPPMKIFKSTVVK